MKDLRTAYKADKEAFREEYKAQKRAIVKSYKSSLNALMNDRKIELSKLSDTTLEAALTRIETMISSTLDDEDMSDTRKEAKLSALYAFEELIDEVLGTSTETK